MFERQCPEEASEQWYTGCPLAQVFSGLAPLYDSSLSVPDGGPYAQCLKPLQYSTGIYTSQTHER